ncbi:MAG: hypothetical protein Q8O37_16475 [Sulfuricellaceae bacterium]|nr:hypothetical protein [Sulfuricellaceae bacterium]
MSEDYAAMFSEVSDEDFPLVLRMQLESTNLEDLPEELRLILLDRADKLGIQIVPGADYVFGNRV